MTALFNNGKPLCPSRSAVKEPGDLIIRRGNARAASTPGAVFCRYHGKDGCPGGALSGSA